MAATIKQRNNNKNWTFLLLFLTDAFVLIFHSPNEMTNFLSLTMQCYIHLSSSKTHNYSRNMTNIIHYLTFIYHKKIMQKIFCLLFCIFLSDKTVNPKCIIFICFIKVFIAHQPFLHNKQMIRNCVSTVWKDVSSAWEKLLFPFHNTQLIPLQF